MLVPAASLQAPHGSSIDRIFQFLLSVVFIGAIYRYCWRGKVSIHTALSPVWTSYPPP